MYNKDIGLPHVNLFLARRFLGVSVPLDIKIKVKLEKVD